MNIVAVVQARMGSTRLPGKVMKEIAGTPLIELLLKRLSKSLSINEIIVATSDDEKNQPLIDHVKKLGYRCVIGSESNVLSRYIEAIEVSGADVVVRVTGDCPLIDPVIVDAVINEFSKQRLDYCSNIEEPTFPDGLDVEVFKAKVLIDASKHSLSNYDKEHVTPFLRNSSVLKIGSLTHKADLSNLRWTVDETVDLELVKRIYLHFSPDIYFSWIEVLELAANNSGIFDMNKGVKRNEGAILSEGQKLWRRAKKIIPGGNMLLSKRAEMHLPDSWPSYFSKSKGCTVWDLEGQSFTDMSLMGVGTNILGYGHSDVDAAVRQVIDDGNMSTLNCSEEVLLAEKLIELHPWADMVRLARTGGEANAIAVRIARAASGRDGVAVCGYHGWHDWYLSANLSDDDMLDGHLLPGLNPLGVPSSLKGTVFPFEYNNFEQLADLVQQHDIGVIKMEVVRNEGPKDGFLEKVRKLADQKGIVLVFDECTSGFRQSFGGIHKCFGVDPDIAVFGKALGNGYAITAIIGKREVMEAAQSTFISSTFWSERIGPAAALKTLEIMGKEKSWNVITDIGNTVSSKWLEIAESSGVEVKVSGIPALSTFNLPGEYSLEYKTLITQEMLKKGYLAGTSLYACIEHSENIISDYVDHLSEVFKLIAKCEKGANVYELLDGPSCHAGFKRLN
ncbi:aminotransferase class III-fold pyridoxal phosphate-dependent enzyme [Gammaproteobacteria bacterium]|nr:aminotransferase class III-fold pyridoxal phosphate-dependent enzyme [Gammaproteobacteria bacterium]